MTSAQVVETSVTNNSSFQNYTHPDDHTIRIMDQEAEIFKPKGTQNYFLTRSTCTRQEVQWIEAAILEVQTTQVDELSESHSEHNSIEGMRTFCSPNIN